MLWQPERWANRWDSLRSPIRAGSGRRYQPATYAGGVPGAGTLAVRRVLGCCNATLRPFSSFHAAHPLSYTTLLPSARRGAVTIAVAASSCRIPRSSRPAPRAPCTISSAARATAECAGVPGSSGRSWACCPPPPRLVHRARPEKCAVHLRRSRARPVVHTALSLFRTAIKQDAGAGRHESPLGDRLHRHAPEYAPFYPPRGARVSAPAVHPGRPFPVTTRSPPIRDEVNS